MTLRELLELTADEDARAEVLELGEDTLAELDEVEDALLAERERFEAELRDQLEMQAFEDRITGGGD